jgi:DNA-binding beta-propeller fold protein YncE
MKRQRRGERILLLVIVGLAAALVVLYLTAPPPTVLAVRVIDAETGAPLADAQVGAGPRNGLPLPVLLTDNAGVARFENAPPDPAYSIRVQKVDFDLGSKQDLAVTKEQETEVVVSLIPHSGEQLFVGLDKARIAEIDTASWLTVQVIHLPVAPEAQVYHLLLHPHEDLLYAVAGDRGLILDSGSGATLGQMQVETGIDTLDLSADGECLLVTTVPGGVDPSGAMGRVHLMALNSQSGEITADWLLPEIRGWAEGILQVSGGATIELVSQAQGAPASVPDMLWRPEGSNAHVLRAADPVVRGLNARSEQIMRAYGVSVASHVLDGPLVLSRDRRYVLGWQQRYRFDGEWSDLLATIGIADGTTRAENFPWGTSALAVAPLKDEVYLLNSLLGTLTIVDLTGQQAQTVVAVGNDPELIAIQGDGQRAFVGNRGSQTVSVVDLALGSVVFTVPLPGEPLSSAVR